MQTDFAPHLDLADSHPSVQRTPPVSRVWMFWAGIVISSLGALLILTAAAGLPAFDHWSFAGLVVASPLFGLVWLLDVVGLGLAYENGRALMIEIAAGGVLCLVGTALLAAHHVRELRASCVTGLTTMPSSW
jgi:hypothetical protein